MGAKKRTEASTQAGRRHAARLRSGVAMLICLVGAASCIAKAFAKNSVVVVSEQAIEPVKVFYLHGLLQELPGHFRALPHRERLAFVSITGARAVASNIGGRLYLSLDYGQHWSETAAPWKGSMARLERVSLAAKVPLDEMPANRVPANQVPETDHAKGEASVRGTVHDPTGAVIPDACLTLNRASGGTAARQSSDRAGSFMMSHLASGEYVLRVIAPGFSPYQRAIVLAHSQAQVSDVMLSVGFTTETVTMGVDGEGNQAESTAPYGWTESQVFEVTLIGGEHWTSPDGFVWSQELQVVEPEPAVPAEPPPFTCPILR